MLEIPRWTRILQVLAVKNSVPTPVCQCCGDWVILRVVSRRFSYIFMRVFLRARNCLLSDGRYLETIYCDRWKTDPTNRRRLAARWMNGFFLLFVKSMFDSNENSRLIYSWIIFYFPHYNIRIIVHCVNIQPVCLDDCASLYPNTRCKRVKAKCVAFCATYQISRTKKYSTGRHHQDKAKWPVESVKLCLLPLWGISIAVSACELNR